MATLITLVLGSLACFKSALALQQTPTATTAVVSPGGGTVELVGVGTVTFPAGAFRAPRQVTLSARNAAETHELYVQKGLYLPFDLHGAWELRINSGDVAPDTPVRVSLVVPSAFLDSLPSGGEPLVFARLRQESALDLIDSFVLIFPASFDSSTNRITAELDAAFTDQRTPDGTFEAIVVLGSARR